MAYKEKSCKLCGKLHTTRGEYCSRSCGNQKPHTEQGKANIALGVSRYMATESDSAQNAKYALRVANNQALEPVPPQHYSLLQVNQYVEDGDLWEEA